MAKKKQKIVSGVNNQLNLFDFLKNESKSTNIDSNHGPGSLNMQISLRQALNEAIKQCPLSRWQIAGKMSELVDHEVSKYMLDSWTSESKEGHRFPAEYLPAFCHVTGILKPLQILGEAINTFTMPGGEALRAEIQKLDEEEKKIRSEKRRRMILLKELCGDD